MNLHYKTQILPFHFKYFGILLLFTSIWRILILDWIGIVLFIIALLLITLKSGIEIDTKRKILKKYDSLFFIKKGKWIDLKSISSIKMEKIKESQVMNVASISRIETNVYFKLSLNLSNENIELISGEKESILKKADELALFLKVPIIS